LKSKSEPTYFVSGDKWLRLPGGKLDATDKQILKDCGKNVVVITLREMVDRLQKEDPEKFKKFHHEMNIKHGKVLTTEELTRLAGLGDETMQVFRGAALLLDIAHAQQIRKWRVEDHLTWRAIARRASKDSSQLLGMALCERAALMCGEDYLQEPWN
jgi:alkylated DNA nucleotide flippase Atl1